MKQRFYVLSIFLFLSSITLFATPRYNVGIIHNVAPSDQHNIEFSLDSIISFFPMFEATKRRKESVSYRKTREIELQEVKAQNEAIKMGKQSSSIPQEISLVESDTFDVHYTLIDASLYNIATSESLDPLVLNHLCLVNDLDEIIVISLFPFDTLHRLTIHSFTPFSGHIDRVFDRLIPEISKKEYEKVLIRAFMDMFDKEQFHLVSISSSIPSLKMSINNGAFEDLSYIMTKDDSVTLSFQAPNYNKLTQTIDLREQEIYDLSVTLEKLPSSPILINSKRKVEATLSNSLSIVPPYIFESPTFPFTISITKDGFSSKSIIIDSPISQLDITLQQQHLAYTTIIPKVQDAFYSSLFRTVLIASASILLSSFLPSSEIDGVKTIHSYIGGITIVSSVETIFRLFDYYEKTKYSIKN